jgi:hypothetical protein
MKINDAAPPTIQQALDELRGFLTSIPEPDCLRPEYLIGIIELHMREYLLHDPKDLYGARFCEPSLDHSARFVDNS